MKPGQLWCAMKPGLVIYLLKKGNRNMWKAIIIRPGKWTWLEESNGGLINLRLNPNRMSWQRISLDEL